MNQTPITPPASDNFLHPLRTLVADDSVVLRQGLYAYLKTQPLFQVVDTTVRGRQS